MVVKYIKFFKLGVFSKNSMNWPKLLYVLIIVLLYVPMVFLGANVFFPEYTGQNKYFHGFDDCYLKHTYPPDRRISGEEELRVRQLQQKCQEDQRRAQQKWEDDKLKYEGQKYVMISLFNLVVLLVAAFLPWLQETVSMGLFLGSIGATFGATVRYFDTRSKIGFVILVITFVLMLFFINHKKDVFIPLKQKKK